MIVFISARRQQLGWHSSLDHLSHKFSNEKVENNFLLVYTPMQEMFSSIKPDRRIKALTSIPGFEKHRVFHATSEMTHEDFILSLLETEFQEQPDVVKRLFETLLSVSPIELAEKFFLLHCRDKSVPETVVFWGSSTHGLTLPGFEKKADNVLLLISPLDQSPEAHLKTLSSIAKFVQSTR